MENAKVNVLGSEWTIEFKKLDNFDGLCDHSAKQICINNSMGKDIQDPLENQKKALRHELVHAFLFESGLGFNCDWAMNEEIIDWIAIQFPKMAKAMEMVDVLTNEEIICYQNLKDLTEKCFLSDNKNCLYK